MTRLLRIDAFTLPVLLMVTALGWPASAAAQQLAALRLDRDRAGLMETVKISIDLGALGGDNVWCGLRLNFGDGDIKELRAEQSPLVVYKQYPHAGTYTVRVSGESMTRGLKSASACQGGPFSTTLAVVDATAERNRQEALRAADSQVQAAAERERQLAQREQQLLQRLRAQDEREQKLAARDKEQDERERRLRSREAQVAQQQAQQAAQPAPVPVAVSPPPAAVPASRPKTDKSLSIFK